MPIVYCVQCGEPGDEWDVCPVCGECAECCECDEGEGDQLLSTMEDEDIGYFWERRH